MSGIFNLFGGSDNSTSRQSVFGKPLFSGPTATAINLPATSTAPGKNLTFTRPKPKGLSIRPKSNLNVLHGNINETTQLMKSPKKGLQTDFEKLAGFSKPLSPHSNEKTLKIQALKSKQIKGLLSKSKSPSNISSSDKMQAATFKKPFTPAKTSKKSVEVYPEPEILGNYYNEEENLNSIDVLDKEFVKLLMRSISTARSYEDEGFESDPEYISLQAVREVSVAIPSHNHDDVIFKDQELPDLSDDDF